MNRPRIFPWTQREVRLLVDYDPETGKFSRNGVEVGTTRKDGRRQITLQGTQWLAARLAYMWMTGDQIPPEMTVDHINRNRSDDRWSNLRLATKVEQQRNRDITEDKLSYYFHKAAGYWRVVCETNAKDGRRTHVTFGQFTSEDRARRAAEIAKEEMAARWNVLHN